MIEVLNYFDSVFWADFLILYILGAVFWLSASATERVVR